jgi:hypothetical protein
MRILLTGGSSAGKTTVAIALGERLGVPVHHLDHIAFSDERWTPRPLAERLREVKRIVAEPGWVAEGGHLEWTEPLLSAADVIVWLDVPMRVALLRTHARHSGRNASWRLARLWWNVRWHLRPYRPTRDLDRWPSRAAVRAHLRPHADKVVRLRRTLSADELVALLNARRQR